MKNTRIILYPIAIFVAGSVIYQLVFGGLTFGLYAALPLNLVLLTSYVLFVATATAILMGRARSKKLTLTLDVTATLIVAAGLVLGLGVLLSGGGADCTGLFGSSSDCSDVWIFSVTLALLNPFVVLPIVAVILIMLVLGWYEVLRQGQTKQ